MRLEKPVVIAFAAIAIFAGCSAGRNALPTTPDASNLRRGAEPNDVTNGYGPQLFSYTGAPQTYVVPAGVSNVTITAWGAGAAGGNAGGYTQATVPVSGGEKLSIIVGQRGQTPLPSGTAGAYGSVPGGWGGNAPGGPGGRSDCCHGKKNPDPRGWSGSSGAGGTYVTHGDGSLAIVAGGAGGQSGSPNTGGAGGGLSGSPAPRPPQSRGGGNGGDQSCSGPSSGTQGGTSVFGGGGGGGGYCGGTGGTGSWSSDGHDVGDTGGGGASGFTQEGATNATTTQGGGNANDGRVLIVPPAKTFTLYTGKFLNNVAVDSKGNAYVSDRLFNTVKEIARDGTVTQVGSGFSSPYGIGVDINGNVYVADWGNQAVKRVSPPFTGATHGKIVTLDGGYLRPYGLALDNAGHIYITATSDSSNPAHRGKYWALRRIDLSNNFDSIVYWDYADVNEGYNVAVDPGCVPSSSSYNTCAVFVNVFLVKSNNYQIWKVRYDGTVSGTLGQTQLGLQPTGAMAFAQGFQEHLSIRTPLPSTLYVTDNNAGYLNALAPDNKRSTLGANLGKPDGVAVRPGCFAPLCSVYFVDNDSGTLKKYVP